MHATCYVIWTDGTRSHFSFSYEEEELRRFPSWKEFIVFRCLCFFPEKTTNDFKWIIRD